MKARQMQKALRELASEEHALVARRFFKTGKGEYGEGDYFLGIRMPVLRKYVRECRGTAIAETLKVLRSRYHEERMFALLLMVDSFNRADEKQKGVIFDAYLDNTQYINNWDLVDSSAYKIVGPYLENRPRRQLMELAKSDNIWERRIAIIATLHFIYMKDFDDTLKITRILLKDEHDLIHKAVGWMLREVGNRDRAQEVEFLDRHYKTMPRTMLRYAIEKFDKTDREAYLKGTR